MASEDAHAIFEKDLYEDFRVRTREALAPGIHLDEQNLRMANQALDVITKTVRIGQMELRQWTEHMILQATSAGFYGMEHPFKDPALEDAMWYVQAKLEKTPNIDHQADHIRQELGQIQACRTYWTTRPLTSWPSSSCEGGRGSTEIL